MVRMPFSARKEPKNVLAKSVTISVSVPSARKAPPPNRPPPHILFFRQLTWNVHFFPKTPNPKMLQKTPPNDPPKPCTSHLSHKTLPSAPLKTQSAPKHPQDPNTSKNPPQKPKKINGVHQHAARCDPNHCLFILPFLLPCPFVGYCRNILHVMRVLVQYSWRQCSLMPKAEARLLLHQGRQSTQGEHQMQGGMAAGDVP